MDPETSHLVRKTLDLVEENNRILKGLQSTARWNRFFVFLKWLVIIGITFGTYYFIEPYLNQAISTYSGFKTEIDSLQKARSDIPSFLNKLLNRSAATEATTTPTEN